MRVFLVLALAILCLAPWLRNRAYLRDLMDYGLVVAASARIEAGANTPDLQLELVGVEFE